jgi:hypothetical protein
VYVATPQVGEPVEEWILAVGIVDVQDEVDRVFWEIIDANWPPVVKTGCTDSSPDLAVPGLTSRARAGEEAGTARRHHPGGRERSPPE